MFLWPQLISSYGNKTTTPASWLGKTSLLAASGRCFALLLLAAFLHACSSETEPAPSPAEEAIVARNSVEIRAELKRGAPVVARLQLGERVEILERQRRFVRIRTSKGVEGWTRDTRLATAELREFMAQLAEQTRNDPAQGTFRALRPLNVHLEPYRWSPTIHQLQEDEAVELLRHQLVDRLPSEAKEGRPPPAPTGLDDWYLIRLANGHAGWVLATGLYSAIPDDVKQYAERKRITSYFSLGQVEDKKRGLTKDTWLWTQIERSKLPYDFDRIRVFMWSIRRGAYQTIKLERGLEGYLPIEIHPEMETKRGTGTGFSIIVEEDGARIRRTYAQVRYRVYRISEEPAPPPPPSLKFVKEEPPPKPPPTFLDRLRRWWRSKS